MLELASSAMIFESQAKDPHGLLIEDDNQANMPCASKEKL